MVPGKSKLMNFVEDEEHNIRTDSTSWGNYKYSSVKDNEGNEIKSALVVVVSTSLKAIPVLRRIATVKSSVTLTLPFALHFTCNAEC